MQVAELHIELRKAAFTKHFTDFERDIARFVQLAFRLDDVRRKNCSVCLGLNWIGIELGRDSDADQGSECAECKSNQIAAPHPNIPTNFSNR